MRSFSKCGFATYQDPSMLIYKLWDVSALISGIFLWLAIFQFYYSHLSGSNLDRCYYGYYSPWSFCEYVVVVMLVPILMLIFVITVMLFMTVIVVAVILTVVTLIVVIIIVTVLIVVMAIIPLVYITLFVAIVTLL